MFRNIFSKKNTPWIVGAAAGAGALLGGYMLFRQLSSQPGSKRDGFPSGLKDPDNEKRIELTQEEAELRFNWVSDVKYNVVISLIKGIDKYAGATTITFKKKAGQGQMPKELFADFRGKVLTKCELNGQPIKKFCRQRIHFETAQLQEENTLVVEFENSFVHNGQGPHRFTDPADGEDYIWTQFESFFCHLLFPCFDQPSLKASLTMSVIAPEDWKVIVNERPRAPAFKFCKESEEVLGQKYNIPSSIVAFTENYRGEKNDHFVHRFD